MKSKLVLGTAQFGLHYGINNYSGKLKANQVFKVLSNAYEMGIETLDTAELYGDAHKLIGDFHKKNNFKFKIMTKLPHEVKYNLIKIKVLEYLNILNIKSIDVLMFHSFESFQSNNKSLSLLNQLKDQGYIKNIGVSAYTNHQLELLLNQDSITVVQLPFNLLDNFNIRGLLIDRLKKKGKTIHSRSAFLQGLFFKEITDTNNVVQKLKLELDILNQIVIKSNCSMEQLALGYCLSQKNIDNVIIGVDSITQLNNNINAASYKIEQETLNRINSINVEDLDLLNPSLW